MPARSAGALPMIALDATDIAAPSPAPVTSRPVTSSPPPKRRG